ncbi:MAG: hypothetical protein ABIZ49_00410 [Opitutaceae bacterium]
MANWLLIALSPPLIFFGGCALSVGPLWEWQELRATHPVRESEKDIFPLLALKNGKYIVTGQQTAEGAAIVTSVSRPEEKKINRDLSDLVGQNHNYRWFRILEESGDVIRVSLEAPTGKESKRKGWYTLSHGLITPERIVYYGPGFAFFVMPWALGVGTTGVVIYYLLVRRLRSRTSPRAAFQKDR